MNGGGVTLPIKVLESTRATFIPCLYFTIVLFKTNLWQLLLIR
jgi:hypothetical protein